MIIYLSDCKQFNPKDSYEKMMNYTTCIFNANEKDLLYLQSDPIIKSRKVIWFDNCSDNVALS